MRILILNWRDIKNPGSGGAEILTHEIARRSVLLGNEVTQFSSFFSGAKRKEIIDGVTIIREGRADTRSLFLSVHFKAFLFYLKKKENYDVVIDEVHGVPFFTPFYVRKKKVVLICEVANDLWVKNFGLFFGNIGRSIEKLYLSKIYKNIPYVTISQSTKKDLISHGVDKDSISILPMGITIPKKLKKIKRENNPTFIFVGRLNPAKGIEDVLSAFQKIQKKHTKAHLWIVGRGSNSYKKYLMSFCKKLGIDQNVTFFGFVSEEEKFMLLARAHLLVHTSIREGFGLTIPEAGWVGTPVIAYNSPGLRDVVKNDKNGVLLEKNNYEKLAEKSLEIVNNLELYKKLCKGAREEARKYKWNNTVESMLNILRNS